MNEENSDITNGCSKGRTGTQNEAALLALMETTGYNMVQENGQRKFGGPPPGWEGPPPPRGCEVFVGKIPRDMYEDELVPVFERAGKIYEFRLMMEFSGENRGYAFVMYTTKEEAQLAIRMLNNYEIRPGKFIGVCVSLDNCRLFIGAIPKEKKKEEIFDEMKKVTEGVVDVIVYPSATDKTKNRGFAFVEYESHRAAAMARRKLIPGYPKDSLGAMLYRSLDKDVSVRLSSDPSVIQNDQEVQGASSSSMILIAPEGKGNMVLRSPRTLSTAANQAPSEEGFIVDS